MEVALSFAMFVALGAVIGFVGALVGIGGGIVAIPMLAIVFDMPQQLAQGTGMIMIVANVLFAVYGYNKNNKIDLTPMEDTLNRFLVAMDEKMSTQQSRIDSLEAKLAEFTDTTQLTKKVGGMDRQIAKLNKSIEKIASHVIEK